MWRSPEELVGLGFELSRVVMINEFHNGYLRCVRTREVGCRILPAAHDADVRHLAMEALNPQFSEESNRSRQLPPAKQGYLSQPEMRVLMQAALDLGWALIPYEADMAQLPSKLASKGTMSQEVTNWREEAQTRNLIHVLYTLPAQARLLVWCGNGHHTKEVMHFEFVYRDGQRYPKPADEADWTPMGYLFKERSGLDPFTIHQIVLVSSGDKLLDTCASQLETFQGTAGFLKEDIPDPLLAHFSHRDGDAFILSIHNTLE